MDYNKAMVLAAIFLHRIHSTFRVSV